jgi:hypothetical protein
LTRRHIRPQIWAAAGLAIVAGLVAVKLLPVLIWRLMGPDPPVEWPVLVRPPRSDGPPARPRPIRPRRGRPAGAAGSIGRAIVGP